MVYSGDMVYNICRFLAAGVITHTETGRTRPRHNQGDEMMNAKPHYCSKCKSDLATADNPAEATGLFVGKFWNEYSQRVMPVRAWLCDMHADQAESGKFVKLIKEAR